MLSTRPRLSIRRLMAIVAVVAMVVWAATVANRRSDYGRLAQQHEAVARVLSAEIISIRRQGGREEEAKMREWALLEESRLEGVYRRAMQHPWARVGPDEGEPRPAR